MKLPLALLLAAAWLAGCTHAQLQLSSSTLPSTPSTTAGASVQGGSGATTLIWLGLAAVIYGAEPDGTGFYYDYGGDPRMAGASAGARPPPLAPARRISEQDCSRPIEDASANLKCR